MPDLDILDHAATPGWHKPYRLLAGNASPQEVGRDILSSLSQSLRRGGGLPEADALRGIVERAAAGQLAPFEALRQLRSVELSAGGHRHTKVAARAAAELVVALEQGDGLTGDPAQAVAEGFCWAIIDHYLFGRARPKLIGQRFADHGEAIAWEQECKEVLRPSVRKMAEALARDPQARKIRAPRMPGLLRRSTVDLLHEPITSLGKAS